MCRINSFCVILLYSRDFYLFCVITENLSHSSFHCFFLVLRMETIRTLCTRAERTPTVQLNLSRKLERKRENGILRRIEKRIKGQYQQEKRNRERIQIQANKRLDQSHRGEMCGTLRTFFVKEYGMLSIYCTQ